MKKIHFGKKHFLSTVVLSFFCLLGYSQSEADKPNVLFIMTDQQSYDMMGHLGKKGLHTPNLDKLAARGYSFNKTYVTNPVCAPSRFSLMTGHYSSDIGVKQNLNSHSQKRLKEILDKHALGKIFKNTGYRTLYSGKTHLIGSKTPKSYGFEFYTANPYEEPVFYAEKVFQEIVEKKDKQPFFLFLSFMNPHDICYKAGADKRFPDKLNKELTEETLRFLSYRDSIPTEVYESQIPPAPDNTLLMQGIRKGMVGFSDNSSTWDEDQWELYRWMYNRLTESVDTLIGRVLTALEQSGLDENTIIVFTSDHGEMNGAHGLILKNVMFEEAQRVPFIFAGKGIKKGVLDQNTLACNGLDFLPTICDLTSVAIPDDLIGVSLKPQLTGKGNPLKRGYLITESFNSYQITDGRYKLTLYELPDNPEFLVDLKVDPGENINFALNSEYDEIKLKLKKALYKDLSNRNLLPLRIDRTWRKTKDDDKKIKALIDRTYLD